MVKRFILSTLCFGWAGFGFASNSDPSGLWLKCEAVAENVDQPCSGDNSKAVTIAMGSPNGHFIFAESYGGCFPVRDKFFGVIENTSVAGSVVSFLLKSTGSYSFLEDIPEVDPVEQTRYINASYDLNSKLLSIEESDLPWYYQNPGVLKCEDVQL